MDDSEQKLGSRPLIARKRIVIAKRGAILDLYNVVVPTSAGMEV